MQLSIDLSIEVLKALKIAYSGEGFQLVEENEDENFAPSH